MIITSEVFDPKYKHIREWSLISDKLIVKVINLGATITSIQYLDNHSDVVLGYDSIDDYMTFENYFGATIGRCANRIKGGSFTLHDECYALDVNDHGNALHGGLLGLHGRIFEASIENQKLVFRYISKDQEEGYPGTMEIKVTLSLVHGKLEVSYDALSDKDTLCNLTNHSYFALQGTGDGSVDKQIVKMNCDKYAENDEDRLVNGCITKVEGTPFDFRDGKRIEEGIYCKEDEQISFANGYDHYFIFDPKKEHEVSLYDETTRRKLTVKSDMPGFHFYVPDYAKPCIGKGGKEYVGHCACCIETSFFPDAIHVQEEPETILKANTKFHSVTTYEFT